jgi:hypothetical protein
VWDVTRLKLDEREAGAAPPCVRSLKLFAPKFNPSQVRGRTLTHTLTHARQR